MTNKNKAIIALIITLAATAIFCYWTNRNKEPYSQSENAVATSSSTKLYRNDEFGFQFEYYNDEKYNLEVISWGSSSRDLISRLGQFCLTRNSVQYRTKQMGVRPSVCLTVYDKDVDKNRVLPYQITDIESKLVLSEPKKFFLNGVESNKITWGQNDQLNTGIYLDHKNYFFVLTFINTFESDAGVQDVDLLLETFKFTK